ncbi:unnamed protein product, partial [marine sediment metagenome]
MTRLCCIDPGAEKSGWVLIDADTGHFNNLADWKILEHGWRG